MRVLRAISGPVWEGPWEGHSGVILEPYLDPIWTLSQKPHKTGPKPSQTAVGRALWIEYTKYGS